MKQVEKLIEYSEIAGFHLIPNGDKLTVINGSNLPERLKKLLIIHKNDIIQILNQRER